MKKYVFGLGSAQVLGNQPAAPPLFFSFSFAQSIFSPSFLFICLLSSIFNVHDAGLGDSSGCWFGRTFCFWAAWSCFNCHWKWPGTIFHCCCSTGSRIFFKFKHFSFLKLRLPHFWKYNFPDQLQAS